MMKKNKQILLPHIFFITLIAFSLYLYIEEKNSNETILETYRRLDSDFGVGINHLFLTSAEGDFSSRSGYVQGEGTDQNGNIIKFYHDWGWCSSGGADCNFALCFSAPTPEKNIHYYVEVNNPEPNYIYELMKKNLCSGNGYAWSSSIETDCKLGKFEEIMSGRIIFSLVYSDESKFTKGPNVC